MENNSCKVSELIIKQSDTPIKCWKIFKVKGNTYFGPFTDFNFGKLKQGDIIYPKGTAKIKYNEEDAWYELTDGFIHTLNYCPENLKSFICPKQGERFEVWECEIPQNSLFFQANRRGSHYESNNSYACKALKLNKFIKSIEF